MTTLPRFTRMDESTAEQWAVIGAETSAAQPLVAERVLTMLDALADMTVGFAVDQRTHCLQTAALAERDGADDELIVAALCHDVGKFVSTFNHPAIAADILRPYVRPEVAEIVRVHQDFQGRHYFHHFGGDPDARAVHEGQPWFDLAARFADDWDQAAFDPDFPTPALDHYAPLVREVFSTPKTLF